MRYGSIASDEALDSFVAKVLLMQASQPAEPAVVVPPRVLTRRLAALALFTVATIVASLHSGASSTYDSANYARLESGETTQDGRLTLVSQSAGGGERDLFLRNNSAQKIFLDVFEVTGGGAHCSGSRVRLRADELLHVCTVSENRVVLPPTPSPTPLPSMSPAPPAPREYSVTYATPQVYIEWHVVRKQVKPTPVPTSRGTPTPSARPKF
jgi:hypothetical protein